MFAPSAPPGDPWRHRLEAEAETADLRSLERLTSLVDGGDIAAVNRFVRRSWSSLLRTDLERLRATLGRIDAEQRANYPLIPMLQAIVTLPSRIRRAKAARYFLLASRATTAREGEPDPLDTALVRVGEAVACRIIGPHARARSSAERAASHLRRLDEHQLAAIDGAPLLFLQVGKSLHDSGNATGALALFEEGLALAELEHEFDGLGNVSMLAGLLAVQGELVLAEEYVELVRSGLWAERETRRYPGVFYRIAEAIMALEEGDPAGAARHLALLENDRRTTEDWIAIASAEALVGLHERKAPEAIAALERTIMQRGREGRNAQAVNRLAPIRALLETAQGNPGRATSILLRDAAPSAQRAIGLARAELCLDRPAEALVHLQHQSVDGNSTVRLRLEAAVLETAARIRIPGMAPCVTLVRKLGGLARETGLRMPLALLPQADFDAVRETLTERGFGDLFSAGGTALLERAHSLAHLTHRERAVFDLIAAGRTPAQIAATQFVSINTVKTQIQSIYRKLSVTSRGQVVALAARMGVLHATGAESRVAAPEQEQDQAQAQA
ncbi:LuxR C-terminal-related transcriptional regulator [Leucobacter luti]|uniref:helix-turn-helix transcriptional regulator n=1 Tax=Leucobacter luti TaxID=340320 RepID=UPI003CFE23E0